MLAVVTSERVTSPSQSRYLHNTQQTQGTNIQPTIPVIKQLQNSVLDLHRLISVADV